MMRRRIRHWMMSQSPPVIPSSMLGRSDGFAVRGGGNFFAVQIESGCTEKVGAKSCDVRLLQSIEHLWARVAKRIFVSGRDHREARLDGGEKFRGRGSGAAMMGDLQ